MKRKLYGFAFTKRNISCQTLYSLNKIDHRYLLWGAETMDRYINNVLLKEQPEYVLGMGVYYGRVKHKVRIETQCNNKYKGKFIGVDEPVDIPMEPFLQPVENAVLTDGIGTSYCNLVSLKILKQIHEGNLKSKYTFLHIPKKMNKDLAVTTVQKMIDQIVYLY